MCNRITYCSQIDLSSTILMENIGEQKESIGEQVSPIGETLLSLLKRNLGKKKRHRVLHN